MKRSFYPRLAIDGMRKNRRMYGPYLAMGALMAAICYILSALSRSDALRTLPGGDNLCMIMALGNVVLLIFSVIFLFYTNSFLIRRRRREFGLYNVLGMSKRNLARILTWETLLTAAIVIAGGLFFGVLLVVTRKGGVRENLLVYQVVNIVINVFRSIPFIILLIFLIPLTRAVVGSAIGVKGAILPMVFGTVPFYTRQVEVALAGVNEGKVEAARSMGSGTLGLIFRVYLHEAAPELIRVTTVTAISLIGLTTMAGAVGGGFGVGAAVGHGDAHACGSQHGGIVVAVSDGHALLRRQTCQPGQLAQAGAFIDALLHNIAAIAAGVGVEKLQAEIAVLFLELRGLFLGQEAEAAEGHLHQMVILVLAVHDVVVQVLGLFPAVKLGKINVGVVGIVEGEPQGQLVILEKVHESVHFFSSQAVEGQVIAFGVHQLGAARTDPVIGLEVPQQALAHAGAAAAGGDGDFDARFLHGAHGGGVLLGDLLAAAGAQRAVNI